MLLVDFIIHEEETSGSDNILLNVESFTADGTD